MCHDIWDLLPPPFVFFRAGTLLEMIRNLELSRIARPAFVSPLLERDVDANRW